MSSVNPCLSGGALEIFLEPLLPAPDGGGGRDADSPTPSALPSRSASPSPHSPSPRRPEVPAVIVCSLGRDEPESIRAALDAGVPFIGLVASRRRGEAVLAAAGSLRRSAPVHTPVGLDIGARSAAEIALSIMAQLVQVIGKAEITPPVCGRRSDAPVRRPRVRDDRRRGTGHASCLGRWHRLLVL